MAVTGSNWRGGLERETRLTKSLLGDGSADPIPRWVLPALPGAAVLRIAIFAGIHGDEPAGTIALARLLLEAADRPEWTADYQIFGYPTCNPYGCATGVRNLRTGRDLNREFWKESDEPEVRVLERELRENHFAGLIQLHADDTSDGFYGYVRGATLTENLLRPALVEAEKILPRNVNALIDGFAARDGIIYDAFDGILRAPPQVSPVPFEIILESPGKAPVEAQADALLAASRVVLAEYRRLISFAADL